MPEEPTSARRRRSAYIEARLTDDGRVAPIAPDRHEAAGTAGPSTDSDPALVDAIRREIEAGGGRITFARFMELGLYHPGHGYYATSELRPTRAGDFLTAPEVHPMFGRLLARQLDEMWQRLERPRPFVVREHGAGRGVLGESMLRGLAAEGSPLLESIRYEPVDLPGRTGPALERIRDAGFERAVEERPDADGNAPLTGCVLANELLDALPVHRVGRLDGEFVEWFVVWRDGWFAEEPGSPSDAALADHVRDAGVAFLEGQRAEVCLAAATWVRQAAASLERGFLLLIDYGYPAEQLYGARRLHGTLRAFRGHHVTDDPFRAVGRQDITAHVDLTTIERVAGESGLTVLGRTTQAEFLIGLGLGDLLHATLADAAVDQLPALLAARAAAARFIDPGALGAFAVVVCARGVTQDLPLRGLSFRVPGRS